MAKEHVMEIYIGLDSGSAKPSKNIFRMPRGEMIYDRATFKIY